jgi:hypothetical protein
VITCDAAPVVKVRGRCPVLLDECAVGFEDEPVDVGVDGTEDAAGAVVAGWDSVGESGLSRFTD